LRESKGDWVPAKTTRFEKLLEAVPDALVGMDQKGVIRFVNRQTESLFGYGRDQLIGQPIETLVPEPLWQIYAQNRDEYFADPRTRSTGLELELVGRHRDGTEIPINVTLSHIDTGDVLLVVTAVADVAKHMLAIRNAELIAAMVEYSDDAIMSGTLEGIITSWNPAAEKMYGYTSKEVIGRSARILTPKDRADEWSANSAKAKTGQPVEHIETVRVRKDGTPVPVSLTVAPIHDENGAISGVSVVHRDATEQRQALEDAQRMTAIVEGSDDAIIGETLEGIITSWNPAAERMYGYTREEIVGRSVDPLVPESRKGESETVTAKVRAGQHVDHLDTEGVRKDGTVFPDSLTLSPIRDADGAVVGISVIARDMSEQRRAREVDLRMAAIVEGSNDAIIGRTLDGFITSWNPAAEKMTGYTSEEVLGRTLSFMSPEDRADEVSDLTARIAAGKPIQEFETIRLRKDGTPYPVSLTLSPIRDANGVITGISSIGRDLTESKRAERYARSLFETALDPLVTISPEGKINDVNEAMVTATGVSREALIGTDFSHHFTEPDKAEDAYHLVLAEGSVTDYPLTLPHQDGTLIDVLIHASVHRDFSGKMLGVFAVIRDVTDQKRAFEAAQRMAAIVERSDDAIVGRTLDGVVTSWNPAAERMFGYSSEDIVGESIDLLTPADRTGEAQAFVTRIRAGQPVEHLETTRIRKDAKTIPVSLTVSPICDPDGTAVGASMIFRDMTEQQRAARYARSLIEAGLDPLMTISPEGRITDVNEATERATGVPRYDLIGTHYFEYFTDRDRARAGYERVLAQGSVAGYPLTIRHRDGTLIHLLCTASLYRDVNGELLGVLATGRDVTEQRKAFETAQHGAAIIESSGDAIIGGSLDGLVTSWNPAAERMYGYTGEEIIGKPAKLLTPKNRQGEIKAVLSRIRAGKHVENLESERVRKDGTVFPVSLTVSPIRDADGAVVGTCVIHRDVTGQKTALEAALRMAAIVESSDDAIIGRTLDGTVTSWNAAAERMFGYSGREIVGKPIDLLVPEDRSGETISILAKLSAGKPVRNFETIRLRKDGTPISVSLTISPLRDEKDVVFGASMICRDITDLKHAAQYARSLLEAALDPLVTISPAGKITDVNEAAVKITGVPRNKLIGTDFSRYFTEPDKADEGYQRAFTEGAVTDFPLTLRQRDGTLTEVLYNASVYRDAGGNVLGVFAAARARTA
jgi:PAS domain S-box-containing protein